MSQAVTILGGGNTAFAVAANLALRGFAITIFMNIRPLPAPLTQFATIRPFAWWVLLNKAPLKSP